MGTVIRRTLSICPVCRKRMPAAVIRREDEYFIEKTCPEHGFFSAIIWRGTQPGYEKWGAGYAPPVEDDRALPDCPNECGLCSGHLQKTCCALIEVTRRCNLNCPVCFADAGGDMLDQPRFGYNGSGVSDQLRFSYNDSGVSAQPRFGYNNSGVSAQPRLSYDDSGKSTPEPTVSELYEQFRTLVSEGNTFVHLSGGEPTTRDDLPEIVAAAKKAGCENIQLNTNGIRLGEDTQYVESLRQAGLSFVFMQFDGTDNEIYVKLRGKPLLDEKKAAIKNCADARLGVTLVPTLVPGVNCHNIGDIIDFAISGSPAVRGVHFQPISYFGRYPAEPKNEDRITLPEVLRAIESQTGGKLKVTDFAPSRCDHPYCGFHGDFVVLPKKTLLKLTRKHPAPSTTPAPPAPPAPTAPPSPSTTSAPATPAAPCCCDSNEHLKNRNFVARRWKRAVDSEQNSCDRDDPTSGNDDSCCDRDDSCCDRDDFSELNAFAARLKSHGLTITAMAFQDAHNLDIERLRRCSLHVSENGNTIPFCAKYIT